MGKGHLAGKVADLAIPRSQCRKDSPPTLLLLGKVDVLAAPGGLALGRSSFFLC